MSRFATVGLFLICALHLACSTDTSTSPTNTTSKTQYTIKFGTTNAGLDVSACSVTIPGGLCFQVLNTDANGAFNEFWAPNTANLLQVQGTLTSTTISATLKCVATTATGTLSANVSGAEYIGTATLSGKTIAVRVVKGSSPSCP
jgi:hypothetical protein